MGQPLFKSMNLSQPEKPKTASKPHLFQSMNLSHLTGGKEKNMTTEERMRAVLNEEKVKLDEEKKQVDSLKAGYTAMTQELSKLIEEFKKEKETFFQSVQPMLNQMVLTVAEKVIGQEVATNPEIITQALSKLIQASAATAGKKQIYLNSQDWKWLSEAHLASFEELQKTEMVEWIAQDQIPRGTTILEADEYRLDSSVHRFVEDLWNQLTQPASDQSQSSEPVKPE